MKKERKIQRDKRQREREREREKDKDNDREREKKGRKRVSQKKGENYKAKKEIKRQREIYIVNQREIQKEIIIIER